MFAKMPSGKKYILLGLGSLAFFLIYHFPAQLAWSLLPKQGKGQVDFYGMSGPWHSGTAATGKLLGIAVRNVSWRLRPTPFAPLRGEVGASLAGDGSLQVRFKAGWRGPQRGRSSFAVRAELPVAHVARGLEKRGVAVDGRFVLQLPKVEFVEGVPLRAEGKAKVTDFRSLRPIVANLGDFQGDFSASKEGVRLMFRDQGGPLIISGAWLVQTDGKYAFSAELTPRKLENLDLMMVLSALGPQDRAGSTKVSLSGVLR